MGDMADLTMYDDPFEDEYELASSTEEHIANVKVIHQTDKAYLLQCKHGQFWIPVSIATLDDGDVYFPAWFSPKYLSPKQRCYQPQTPIKVEDEFGVLDPE